MPYLEVSKGNQDEIEQVEQIQVPNVEGMSIKETEKIMKDAGLEIVINNEQEELDKENTIIKNQTPKEGITVNKGSKIYLDY